MPNTSIKVMVAFGPQTFSLLESESKERGISVQELLRAVIIPDWFRAQPDSIVNSKINRVDQNHGPPHRNRSGGEVREILYPANPRT